MNTHMKMKVKSMEDEINRNGYLHNGRRVARWKEPTEHKG